MKWASTARPISSRTQILPPGILTRLLPKRWKEEKEFKETVDRSTTSNDSSKQSQGASNSYPIILATRPPINLATAQPQIKERHLELKISDDQNKAQDANNAKKPPDT